MVEATMHPTSPPPSIGWSGQKEQEKESEKESLESHHLGVIYPARPCASESSRLYGNSNYINSTHTHIHSHSSLLKTSAWYQVLVRWGPRPALSLPNKANRDGSIQQPFSSLTGLPQLCVITKYSVRGQENSQQSTNQRATQPGTIQDIIEDQDNKRSQWLDCGEFAFSR